ncbi:MAG: hypothetical protein QG597_746 [Actinomycetota bacterium]|nr:hypothetical protein [Actinomycetota bacterium]
MTGAAPWSTLGFQLTIDCAQPQRLVPFWVAALGYVVEPPPAGAVTWRDYWLSIGVPESELGDGDCADSIIDPSGRGPRIWFQQVPEPKVGKNRLHLDLKVGGDRAEVPLARRRERIEAEVTRLCAAGAAVSRRDDVDGVDHYYVVMIDPEGNEFCVG